MTDYDINDVVQPDAVTTDLATREQTTALDMAANAALADPGIAGRDEFLSLCLQARMLSMSALAPAKIRGKPYDALLIVMTGRELGIAPTAAVRKISVINGQTSLDTQLLTALVRISGRGSIRPVEENMTQQPAAWAGAAPFDAAGNPMGPRVEFFWADAQDAGLVDPTCQPGQHNIRQVTRQKGNTTERVQGCLCKDNWSKSPRDMLWWRAAARCARIYFPEVGIGLYSPDELGAITDDTGQPIDPTTIELPAGFTDPQAQQREAQAQQDRPADGAELWQLQVRIHALPDVIRAELGDAWKGEQSRVRGYRVSVLPQRLKGTANAMVNAHEAQAKAAGIDLDAAREDVHRQVAQIHLDLFAPQLPQDAPDEPAGPDAPEDPQEAQTDDPGPGSDDDDTADDVCGYEGHASGLAGQGVCEYCGETTEWAAKVLGAVESAVTPESAPEPDEEAKAADRAHWREEMANLAERVKAEGADVPNDVITDIAVLVKEMHHTAINKVLAEAGVPTDGPIDLRRMHVALLKIREHKGTAPRPGQPTEDEPF